MTVLPTSSLPRREQIVFRHFWGLLSITAALAQWGLWNWLLAGDAWSVPWWMHAVVPPVLAVAYRTSARVLEWHHEPPAVVNFAGQTVLITGFIAVVTVAVLGTLGMTWWIAVAAVGTSTANAAAWTPPPIGGVPFQPIGTAAAAASFTLLGYGYLHGFRRLRVQELTVEITGLPAAFEGYRILHASDIHLGPLCHRGALRHAVDRALALDPDLICVTGDIVDTPNCDLDFWLPEIARLTARDGVFAILGNHDRHAGAHRVATAIRQTTAWRLLRNEVGTVRRGSDRVHVVGIEDARHVDAAQHLSSLWPQVPAGETGIVLLHHPVAFDAAVSLGVPLTLAGHTHGGQLALPGIPAINAARLLGVRHSAGRFDRGESTLHVSRGLGTSGQRVRVGAPRDLTVLRLVAKTPSA